MSRPIALSIVSRTSAGEGQMSARNTGSPLRGSCPSGSVVMSMSIRPASA